MQIILKKQEDKAKLGDFIVIYSKLTNEVFGLYKIISLDIDKDTLLEKDFILANIDTGKVFNNSPMKSIDELLLNLNSLSNYTIRVISKDNIIVREE